MQCDGLPHDANHVTRWIHDPSHGELQQYVTGRAENARVAGGVLRVTARREDYEVGW